MHTPSKRFAVLLLAIVLPTLWLHSGRYQLFPPIGWVDPSLYIHWFTSPVQNVAHGGPDYHGARLPFELAGFVLYRLFDPVTAQSCLVTGFYVLGLTGLYTLIATVVQGLPARLVAHWMICLNPIWIATFVQGYVDGPTIAFGLLALALLLDEWMSPARLAFAGMWLALAISTQPFGGGVAGLSAAAILAARCHDPVDLLKAAMWIAVGLGLTVVLLGAAGTVVGIPFFYLGVSRSALSNALAGFDTNYTTPVSSWVWGRFRVVLPLATIMVVGAAWAVSRRQGVAVGRVARRAFVVASLMPLTVFLVFLVHSSFVLEHRFYASYLLLALAPSIVLLVAAVAAGAPSPRWPWAAGAVLGASLLIPALAPTVEGAAAHQVVWAIIALVIGAATYTLPNRPAVGLVLLAVVLAIMGTANDDTAPIFDRSSSPSFRAQQQLLEAFQATLDGFGVAPGRFLIWFGRDAFTDERHLQTAELYKVTFRGQILRLNTLDSLAAAAGGWDASSLGFSMPAFDDISRQNMWRLLSGPFTVILLCAADRACTAGLQTLTEAGFSVTMQQSADISVRGAPFFHLVSVTVRRPS